MPLVMSTAGGMSQGCKKFYARLAEIISYKRGTSYSVGLKENHDFVNQINWNVFTRKPFRIL